MIEAHHKELGGMFVTKCDTDSDLAYIDGICVSCSDICTDCRLEENEPVCKSCADNAILVDGECMCEIGRYFDAEIGSCEPCSKGCNNCIDSQ